MAWTNPRTWTASEVVTAAIMNTHVRDNLSYLKDSPTFDGDPTITGCTTFSSCAVLDTGRDIKLTSGKITIDGANGGWSTFYGFSGSNNAASFGGFGALGSGSSLSYYYIGQSFDAAGIVVTPACLVLINDTSNANMTTGLTINQGAADDAILAFKSSDVAHGMTDLEETDTYGTAGKLHATTGGLKLTGYTEEKEAFRVIARAVNEDSTRSTAASAYLGMGAEKKSGTSTGTVSNNVNILKIEATTGTTRFIFDSDGDLHADAAVSASAYDAYNDAALLRRLDVEISDPATIIDGQFRDWMQYQRPDLERAKLVTFNADGHHFVNYTRLVRAQNGAIWQGYERDKLLAQENAELRSEVAALRGLVVEMQQQMTALTAGRLSLSASAASP